MVFDGETLIRYASAGKVRLVSMWPWPLTFRSSDLSTSKRDYYIFVSNYIEVVNVWTFPQTIYKISC